VSKIPKILHYCWFGANPLPELAEKCIESWKKYCPDFEIRRWDESNFDINCNQYVKEAYESEKWAFVTDYVRLYVVYEHGGIYLDTDVELLKSFNELLNYTGFMGFEDHKHINTGLGFGASKNNQIIYEILKVYENIPFIKSGGRFDLMICPIRNTKVLIKIGLIPNNTKQAIDDVVFLPTEYLSPKDYKSGILNITNNTYSIHHYKASWHIEEDKREAEKWEFYTKIFGKKLGNLIANVEKGIKRYGYIEMIKIAIEKFKTKISDNLLSLLQRKR
jgi:hypothetical protein